MHLGFPETMTHAAQIPQIIFLIFLLVPLYKLAANRTAIYILFSKNCFNVLEICLITEHAITTYFIDMPPLYIAIYKYIMQGAFFATFIHFLAMAINRFHAVFFPFSYNRIWKKRTTQIYIFLFSIFGFSLGCFFVFTYAESNWFLNTVQITVLGGSGAIYSAMIAKFTHELFLNKNRSQHVLSANLEKDRILLSLVALLSILPLPISLILSPLQRTYAGTLIGTFLNCFRIVNYAIMQCIEECFLIIFCEDFRLLIKKQFKLIWQKIGNKKRKFQVAAIAGMVDAGNIGIVLK